LSPLIAPVMGVRPANHPPGGLEGIAATLLTSRNAVSGCPASCHDNVVFAVGDATAAHARQAGFRDVRTASGDAVALARLVAETIRPENGPLFLPAGRRQGFDLAHDLRERGFRVIRRVVYEAKALPALPDEAQTHLRDRGVGVVMFFSAETSRHFVRLIRAARLQQAVDSVEAVSISDRATVALKELPWRRISVAAKPNQDAMLALLQ
jgi:uroporphyrinogen-III synthase